LLIFTLDGHTRDLHSFPTRRSSDLRLKGILSELMGNENIIIFIDEIHCLIGAGSAEGSLDAASIIKPALSRGEVQCIGATTPKEYHRYIERDRSLVRRFQSVKISPP